MAKKFAVLKYYVDKNGKVVDVESVSIHKKKVEAEQAKGRLEAQREKLDHAYYKSVETIAENNVSSARFMMEKNTAVVHWCHTYLTGATAGLPVTKEKLDEAIESATSALEDTLGVAEENWKERSAKFEVREVDL